MPLKIPQWHAWSYHSTTVAVSAAASVSATASVSAKNVSGYVSVSVRQKCQISVSVRQKKTWRLRPLAVTLTTHSSSPLHTWCRHPSSSPSCSWYLAVCSSGMFPLFTATPQLLRVTRLLLPAYRKVAKTRDERAKPAPVYPAGQYFCLFQ